jgi:ABC-type sulfate/molybdate transport systems ATPase subunit
LLLDEPFHALDLLLKQEVIGLFRSLVAERGLTAVTVSHDPRDLLALAADRVAVLEDGRLVDAIATTDLLDHQPQSKLLAAWCREVPAVDGEPDGMGDGSCQGRGRP